MAQDEQQLMDIQKDVAAPKLKLKHEKANQVEIGNGKALPNQLR
ncbi:hypothetical protein OFA97_06280 [Lactiplantibacillus plantarum]|nr:hypothetical protein OFA97_06280 [Lactiplantibacillus plantarum]